MLDACRVLVTGANGFVGSALLKYLQEVEQYHVFGTVRTTDVAQVNLFTVGELSENTDWFEALKGQHVVVHVAARAHIMDDYTEEPLAEYRRVNVAGTLNLARQAASAGVRRFIFISSIKVNGESSLHGNPFTSNDDHLPQDDYGLSKSEAEIQLLELAKCSGMDVVIIRPTLVYGPGVKANFASLFRLVSKGIPLPFGCITKNKRSLVSIDNLVDLIVTCIDHPNAVNQVFLVSDDHDLSTSEIVHEMAIALGKSAWQLPVPMWCYKLTGKIFNKSDVVDRLTCSLQVDICHTKETLGWVPPQSVQAGFKQTAQAFLESKMSSENK